MKLSGTPLNLKIFDHIDCLPLYYWIINIPDISPSEEYRKSFERKETPIISSIVNKIKSIFQSLIVNPNWFGQSLLIQASMICDFKKVFII